MVQVLPYVPSPLEQLTPYISQAVGQIGQGIQQRSALKSLMALENPPQGNSMQQFSESSQPSISPITNAASIYPIAEKALGPEGAKIYLQSKLKQQELAHQDTMAEKKASLKRIEKAEPDLLEREGKLGHYEQEAVRFDRLNELFRPELEDKFPSAFTVGLLTKDGELRPTAAASLSPEAQEAVKLVADNLSGAKDTFGARVTNFDLQSYMKRLPTLLNSSDGRRRVLRDLRLMNKLNTLHENGVLDIIEREGGAGKITISQAERRFRKENSKQIESIKKEFVNAEKNVFDEIPDAKNYQGEVIVDLDTGQRSRSNGKEWVPE